MNYRSFGKTSLRVSEIGFGCGRLGGTIETKGGKEVLRTLLEAFDSGINFYDTADTYGQGRSERLLGQVFKYRRTAVIIATKAGYHLAAGASLGARLKPLVRPLVRLMPSLRKSVQRARVAQRGQDFSSRYLREAIEGSLGRLQTDYLDLFQLHSPPSSIIEKGEFIETLEQAKSEGKIRWYGVSCRTIEDALLCLRQPGISSVQVAINLLEWKGVPALLARTEQEKIAVIARQPLASGFLARPASLLKPEHFPVDQKQFKGTLERAKDYQFLDAPGARTIAQAALRFVLQLPGVSVVIAGMRSRAHLKENLAAPACPLAEDELARIRSLVDGEPAKVEESR